MWRVRVVVVVGKCVCVMMFGGQDRAMDTVERNCKGIHTMVYFTQAAESMGMKFAFQKADLTYPKCG